MVAAAHLNPYRAFLQDRSQHQQNIRQAAQQPNQFSSMLTNQQPWAFQPGRGDPRFEQPPGYAQAQAQVQQRQAALQAQAQAQAMASINPGDPPAIQRAKMKGAGMQIAPMQHFASRQDEAAYDPNGQYSPFAYGGESWANGRQRMQPNPQQRLFDRQGQLNAYDRKDALQQIAYTVRQAARDSRNPRFYRRIASPAEMEERRQVLAAAVQDQEGFRVLGQELLLPIKEIVDYEGFVRRFYRVRPLQQGEYFRMAKDIRATAWVIGQDGQGMEARVGGRYVTPSEFKVGSFPTVDIEDIFLMNFDVLDRAQDTARQEIELEEDKRGVALLTQAAQAVNTPITFGSLGIGAFEDVRYQVERWRLVVEHFLINRAELSDIVKTMSTQVDPVTERELILAGYIGNILNATIMTSAGTGVEEVVPAGTFYATVGPDYLGEMGVRIELFSEPFNMFAQMRFVKGWAMGEMIGFVIPAPRGVAMGRK